MEKSSASPQVKKVVLVDGGYDFISPNNLTVAFENIVKILKFFRVLSELGVLRLFELFGIRHPLVQPWAQMTPDDLKANTYLYGKSSGTFRLFNFEVCVIHHILVM